MAFVKKEMYHILRDWKTLLVLIGMPIAQIVLFGFALSNEVKNTEIAIWDQSNDIMSNEIINKVQASKYFEIVRYIDRQEDIDKVLRSGDSKMVLIFPPSFQNSYTHDGNPQIQIIADGTNPNVATTLINYTSAIVQDYQMQKEGQKVMPYDIDIKSRMLYNPQLKGEFTFVPGVMALVLMLICSMMTSVSIVREKEMGNMEILLVSPMNPLSIIFSKTVPYLLLSIILLTIILLLGVYLLHVPIVGSIILLYGVSTIFIFTSLALGLLISSIADTQQVAMIISMVGLMLPTMMLSGFMFPIESMPWILQMISNIVPAKWFFYSLQAIMIKGLGIESILKEVLIMSGFAIFFIAISLKKFNVRLS